MFTTGNIFTLLCLILMALSTFCRDMYRNSKLLATSEDNDSVTIENPELDINKVTPRQYGAYEEQDEDQGDDIETALQAFIEAAAVVEKLTEDLEDEGRDEMGTKKLGILAQFHPGQILEPIGNKFSELSEALSRPNFGFELPNPMQIWNRIKETGANFLQGANSAIFGSGNSGQDYPFPYRKHEAKSLREELNNYQDSIAEQTIKNIAYWREKLNNYRETSLENTKQNRTPISNPYFFPYFLVSDKFKDVIKNATTN